MDKHTPGSWESFDSNEVIQHEDGTKHIATAWNHNKIGPDEAVANAHVIAAAPDLLAACRKAIDVYELVIDDWGEIDPDGDLPPELEALKAAVAKATGATDE